MFESDARRTKVRVCMHLNSMSVYMIDVLLSTVDEKSLRGILGEVEHKMAEIIHAMHAKSLRKLAVPELSLSPSLMNSTSSIPTISSDPSILGKSEQPYRYMGVRPPTLTLSEMHRKENAEEEYPLTYDELKAKVWRSGKDSTSNASSSFDSTK
ncbi:hypothetical protein DYB30_003807 [Aphanomyces astaci]|uniref:Uncharacterized protein n=1 Tax=Aphanomyces astaci TaxID=112090 RepID=A0A397DE97_APHAT|nr:hypothetical protein DYB30_003807 [Aphanomyces astaci]